MILKTRFKLFALVPVEKLSTLSSMVSYFDETDQEGLNLTLIYVGVNLLLLLAILMIAAKDTRKGLKLRHEKAHALKTHQNNGGDVELEVNRVRSKSGSPDIGPGGAIPTTSRSVTLGNQSQSPPMDGKASTAEFLSTDDPHLEEKMGNVGSKEDNNINNNINNNNNNDNNEEKNVYPSGPAYESGFGHGRFSSMLKSDGTIDESCGATTMFCCATFWFDLLTRSYLYTAVFVHIWDSGSDLGVLYTYYNDPEWRNLAYTSAFIMLAYRIFSSFSLWKAQRGCRDICLQFFDFHLFLSVYRSSLVAHPTDTLYWIRTMEAILEAFPQIVISLVFLYDAADLLVFVSLLGSLASIVFSLLHYTNVVFAFVGIKGQITYWTRFLFRLCEVLGRAMTLALIWRSFEEFGGLLVGAILVIEFVFYGLLTQFSIEPWLIAGFLVADVDLTLTFEGREGALTKPLHKNIFYRLMYKPVSEMFTSIHSTDEEMEQLVFHPSSLQEERLDYHTATEHAMEEEGDKLLIAPAHYVLRFLESIFEIFCILTYSFFDGDVSRVFERQPFVIILAVGCNVLTPILYCIVRSFANEHKTLERNLIALVLDAGTTNKLESLTSEISRLIGAGAKLTQKDYLGNTIVHACVRTNNRPLLQRLIRSGKAPLTKPNKAGFTPVMEAAKYGSLACLIELAGAGIDLNVKHTLEEKHRRKKHYGGRGEGLLHMAAMYNHCDVIAWLCDPRINPDFNKHQVYTGNVNACHAACVHGCLEALELLIKLGISCHSHVDDGDGCQHIAAERGFVAILRVLRQQGVDMNQRGHNGHTPFYRAAVFNHGTTMKLCLQEFGVNHNVKDKNNISIGQRCLELFNYKPLSVLASVQYDFRHCKKLVNRENDSKITPSMWACKENDMQLLGRLILAGADVNHVNSLDETAAHYAAAFGSLECLKLLYTAEAVLTHSNALLKTPLDKCKEHGHTECIEFLEGVIPAEKRHIVNTTEIEELVKMK